MKDININPIMTNRPSTIVDLPFEKTDTVWFMEDNEISKGTVEGVYIGWNDQGIFMDYSISVRSCSQDISSKALFPTLAQLVESLVEPYLDIKIQEHRIIFQDLLNNNQK